MSMIKVGATVFEVYRNHIFKRTVTRETKRYWYIEVNGVERNYDKDSLMRPRSKRDTWGDNPVLMSREDGMPLFLAKQDELRASNQFDILVGVLNTNRSDLSYENLIEIGNLVRELAMGDKGND